MSNMISNIIASNIIANELARLARPFCEEKAPLHAAKRPGKLFIRTIRGAIRKCSTKHYTKHYTKRYTKVLDEALYESLYESVRRGIIRRAKHQTKR